MSKKAQATMRDICNLYGIPHEGRAQTYIMCPDQSCSGGNPNKRKLSLKFTDNFYRCNVCGESGGTGRLMEFMTTQKPVPRDFPARVGMAKLYKALKDKDMLVLKYDESQMPEELPIASLDERNEVYQALSDKLVLKTDHRKALIQNRGFTNEVIEGLGYKSAPQINSECQDLAHSLRWDDGLMLEGIPGFFEEEIDDEMEWSMVRSFYGGTMIPVRSIDKKIQGFQVRQDVPSSNKEVPKFVWMSSSNKESGTGSRTFSHFAGYPERSIFFTEGPLKADLIRHFTNWSGLAVPGVKAIKEAEIMLEELKELGVKKVNIAYDMDWKTNHHVEEGLFEIYLVLKKIGFDVEMLDWDDSEKGLDDYLYAVKKGELEYSINDYSGPVSKSYSDFRIVLETLEVMSELGVGNIALTTDEELTDEVKRFFGKLAASINTKSIIPKYVDKSNPKLNKYDVQLNITKGDKPYELSFFTERTFKK